MLAKCPVLVHIQLWDLLYLASHPITHIDTACSKALPGVLPPLPHSVGHKEKPLPSQRNATTPFCALTVSQYSADKQPIRMGRYDMIERVRAQWVYIYTCIYVYIYMYISTTTHLYPWYGHICITGDDGPRRPKATHHLSVFDIWKVTRAYILSINIVNIWRAFFQNALSANPKLDNAVFGEHVFEKSSSQKCLYIYIYIYIYIYASINSSKSSSLKRNNHTWQWRCKAISLEGRLTRFGKKSCPYVSWHICYRHTYNIYSYIHTCTLSLFLDIIVLIYLIVVTSLDPSFFIIDRLSICRIGYAVIAIVHGYLTAKRHYTLHTPSGTIPTITRRKQQSHESRAACASWLVYIYVYIYLYIYPIAKARNGDCKFHFIFKL